MLATIGHTHPMPKLSTTTKDIGLLRQLHTSNQLDLAPEFQRNSVWPRAAKSYLIDSILHDRPIPVLYFQRTVSAQTSMAGYKVIDGQQRLRAIFEFLDNEFALSDTSVKSAKGKRYSELPNALRSRILQYDLIIQELSDYSAADINDMFVRMNKYVVKLSPAEIRNAKESGAFSDFVNAVGEWPFWRSHRVFTELQLARFRAVEFSAELAILLCEGPQDKKAAVELYYVEYRKKCPFSKSIGTRLRSYLDWIATVLPEFKQTRYRKPTDLYSLVGAIDAVSDNGRRLRAMNVAKCHKRLMDFEKETRDIDGAKIYASRYLVAASRQTDNVKPRNARIDVLSKVLSGSI